MMAVAVMPVSAVVATAQDRSAIEQYHARDRYAKARLIAETVSGKRPATDDEAHALLLAGMKDPDVFVRGEAVSMVANILTVSSMPEVPPKLRWVAARRQVGERLWPDMDVAAADDPEARVRSEALRGIAGAFSQGHPTTVLPSQIANRLLATFENDPDPGLRSLAARLFQSAHRSEDPAVRTLGAHVLLKALDQSEPFMVQAAAHAIADWKPAEALPLLVRQLKNPLARCAYGRRTDHRPVSPGSAALPSSTGSRARRRDRRRCQKDNRRDADRRARIERSRQ
jgi:hypothetical protein